MRARRSLLDLDDLSGEELTYLFERAREFDLLQSMGASHYLREEMNLPLRGVACVNMFFEQSTRTFTSFNLAELRLGADVVNLSPKDLSLATKGESDEDTAITLSAMGISVLVLRHPEAEYPRRISMVFDGHVINAGDGTHAHPTQALLDIHTLREEFGDITGRNVAIVGDILHSRVAHSLTHGLRRMGANVALVGPETFLPDSYTVAAESSNGAVTVTRDFDTIIPDVDAIVLLRIQRERFSSENHAGTIDDREYIERFQLHGKRLAKLSPDAIVMHPGPYNRGVELDDSVLSFTGWRYAKQIAHGVSVRMAVLDFLVNGIRAGVKL